MKNTPVSRLLLAVLSLTSLATCSEPRLRDAHGPTSRRVDPALEDTERALAETSSAATALLRAFGSEGAPRFLSRAWKVQAPGLIADLSVSERGERVLASTIFDAERPDSDANGKRLMAWNGSGGVETSVPLGSQTRTQDLSADGTMAWLSSYDGDFQGWDVKKGRKLWTLSRSCRPVALAEQLVLCVRDDEPRPPEVLFEAVDAKGRIFFAQPRGDSGEVMSVKRAPGGKFFALLLSGGGVQIFKAGAYLQSGERVPFVREVARFRTEGEALDAEFGMPADGEEEGSFAVSVLSIDEKGRPFLEVFDASGRRQGGAQLDRPALQVACSTACRNVVLYGNGLAGQWVAGIKSASLRLPGGQAGELPPVSWNWTRRLPRSADYSSRLVVPPRAQSWKASPQDVGEEALVGFEWSDGLDRRSFLVAFDSADGAVRWLVPIDSGEGAYLYAYGVSSGSNGGQLVVATDDGWLRAFNPR